MERDYICVIRYRIRRSQITAKCTYGYFGLADEAEVIKTFEEECPLYKFVEFVDKPIFPERKPND